MGSAVKLLCEHQDIQTRLRENPERIADFIEETLRYESPFGGHFRKCRGGSELHGVSIPDGARVMLLWGSGNRDERYWDHPDEISIDRPHQKSHLGFGFGVHACLGQKLARIEVRVVLEELLKATELMERGWQECRYVPSAFVRSPQCLWIRDRCTQTN